MDSGQTKKGVNSQTYTPEQIINKLREAEIHINRGIAIAEASRKISITQQTYYHWRKEYGCLRIEQAKKLKSLEKKNGRLKKLVADLSLAKAIRRWLNRVGVKTLFIEPGSPWEIFTTLAEAKVLIEQWGREYNQVRPHSALGYRPPAPEAIIPITQT